MKLRMKEQLICYVLVVVLLVMGMQVEVAPINPSFLRGENTVSAGTVSSVIRSGSHLLAAKEDCTIDMIQRSTSTYQNSNNRSLSPNRVLKLAILLLVVELLLLQKFYFGTAIDNIAAMFANCHIATVLYIHQKDGKK